MFGELLGLWCVATWQQAGSPRRVRLCELGPGKGTMMADALRAANQFEQFGAALASIALVEASPHLRAEQSRALGCGASFVDHHAAMLATVDGKQVGVADVEAAEAEALKAVDASDVETDEEAKDAAVAYGVSAAEGVKCNNVKRFVIEASKQVGRLSMVPRSRPVYPRRCVLETFLELLTTRSQHKLRPASFYVPFSAFSHHKKLRMPARFCVSLRQTN